MAFNTFSIPGGYSEFETIGRIFALENGQTSVPLKGDNAVYVVSMTNKVAPGEAGDLAADKSSMLQRMEGRVENGVFNALRESVGVKDNRHLFY
jgi:peptidyl-prolyl cis-trans isomerase D